MPAWEEKIEPSAGWQSLERLRATIAELSERHHDREDALGRPRRLAEIGTSRLRSSEIDLISATKLGDVASKADLLTSALHAHLEPEEPEEGEEPNTVDLGSVQAATDNFADEVNTLPTAQSDEQVALAGAYRTEVEVLRSQLDELHSRLTGEIEQATSQHLSATKTSNDRVAELGRRVDEVKAALEAMSTDVDAFLTERAQQADELTAAAKTASDEQRAAAALSIEELTTGATEKVSAELERERAEFEATLTEQRAAGGGAIAELEALKTKAETLVGAVGRTGLSGGFQEWERSEKKQADAMRKYSISFGALAALSVVGLLVARELPKGDPSDVTIPLAVAALAIPGALGGIAAYLGRESSKHRRTEVLARRTELELASFGPYLATLDDEQQAELTAMFAPVFFGQTDLYTRDDDARASSADGPRPLLLEMLDRISQIIIKSRSTPS